MGRLFLCSWVQLWALYRPADTIKNRLIQDRTHINLIEKAVSIGKLEGKLRNRRDLTRWCKIIPISQQSKIKPKKLTINSVIQEKLLLEQELKWQKIRIWWWIRHFSSRRRVHKVWFQQTEVLSAANPPTPKSREFPKGMRRKKYPCLKLVMQRRSNRMWLQAKSQSITILKNYFRREIYLETILPLIPPYLVIMRPGRLLELSRTTWILRKPEMQIPLKLHNRDPNEYRDLLTTTAPKT